MKTYQTTKRKLTKQPNKNLPNNQIKTCQTTKLLLETVVLDGTDGCRSVCLQTSEGWRFSGSNRLSKRMNNDY